MKNNILYFLLGIIFIITISSKSGKKEHKLNYRIGSYVSNGDGYELYKHNDGNVTIYVVKSTNSYPVSISVSN